MHLAVSRAMFEDRVGRFPGNLAQVRGWTIHQKDFPILDLAFAASGRTPIRLRCDFSNWDEAPPSIQLQGTDGSPLQSLSPGLSGVFNGSAHPATGLPFICTAGSREFHIHPSHSNETWDQFRGKPGFDLGEIVDKLWHAWLKGTG